MGWAQCHAQLDGAKDAQLGDAAPPTQGGEVSQSCVGAEELFLWMHQMSFGVGTAVYILWNRVYYNRKGGSV